MAPEKDAPREKVEENPKNEDGKKDEPDVKEEEGGAKAEEDANMEATDSMAKEEEEEYPEMKTEEEEAPKDGDPGKPSEQEEDAGDDKRPKVKPEQVSLNMSEATPNVMPSADGKLLATLCDGGFQYLFAGVRSTAGVKAGRYMFEAKIVEILNPYEGQAHRQGKTPLPKQVVRLGFSIAGSSSLLDDEAGKVYFDSEGNFIHQGKRTKVAQPFRREQVIAVLLNLDQKSPNANTISVFRDGKRLCEPQPLPESLVGKALYPSITYKNMTLQVNWGPTPKRPLPFRCFTLREAAAEDLELAPVPPEDGKREVLFPVGLPDQGIFDWLDQFLEEHPKHLELSDRKVLEWASTSGLFRPKGFQWKVSNDKPGMNFGISMLDDFSIQKVLMAVAPALRRDIVCMELNANLQASERQRGLARFPAAAFKRVAVVAMGEPPAAYKAKVQDALLAEKVAQAEKEKREKEEAARRKDEMKDRRPWRAEKSRDQEEKDGEQEDGEKAKDVDTEGKGNAGEAGEKEEDKPVELTEQEKAMWHRKSTVSDLTSSVLAKSFASYSVPKKEEGFDEVRYVWQGGEKCAEIMREWVLEHKRTQRVEDLEPSAWFKEKWTEWQKVLGEWKKKQSESKEVQKRKKADGKKDDKKKEKREEEKKEAGEGEGGEKSEDKAKAMDIDEDELNVFTVEDVNDIGNGRPLFINFAYEDWTLLSLRYEFHLLVYAFQRDVDDPDRPGFHESHLTFYYNKYFNKAFNVKYFGVQNIEEFCALIKDAAAVNAETKFLEAVMPEDTPLDKFVKYTEEHRRERQRNIDAGDETASLKFTRPAPPPPWQAPGGAASGTPHRGSAGAGSYQRSGGGGGQSRGPPPPIGRAGPPSGGGGYGGRGAQGSHGAPPRRSGYDAPLGRARGEPGRDDGRHGGSSQKRPHTPPPPTPSYGYPPSKHQRSSYGGSGPPRTPAPPRSSYGSGGGSYSGRSYR